MLCSSRIDSSQPKRLIKEPNGNARIEVAAVVGGTIKHWPQPLRRRGDGTFGLVAANGQDFVVQVENIGYRDPVVAVLTIDDVEVGRHIFHDNAQRSTFRDNTSAYRFVLAPPGDEGRPRDDGQCIKLVLHRVTVNGTHEVPVKTSAAADRVFAEAPGSAKNAKAGEGMTVARGVEMPALRWNSGAPKVERYVDVLWRVSIMYGSDFSLTVRGAPDEEEDRPPIVVAQRLGPIGEARKRAREEREARERRARGGE